MILRASAMLFLFTFSKAYVLNVEECLNYTVYPVQYELILTPYIMKNMMAYDCDLVITIIANAPDVKVIELDAKDILIREFSVQVTDGKTNLVNIYRPYEYNKESRKIYIYLNQALNQYSIYKTLYYIKMHFTKHVKNEDKGVFIVGYDSEGTSKNMLVTRPSPNKAKYLFPCFDNLQFESVFKFKLRMTNHTLSNVNIPLFIANEQRRYTDTRKVTIIDYMPSPQIAVHQVGFHLSDFDHRQATSRHTNDTLIIWAKRNTLQYYKNAIEFGINMIDLIHEYSRIDRPLVIGPINIVSVPELLNGYEIDSWNLLTTGENRLAYITNESSSKQKDRMMFELTQQLCRIWLGNPGEQERTRWQEQWFKEGVATYLAYYFIAQYRMWYPETRLIEAKHKAMSLDWHHSNPALATFNRTLAVEIPTRYKDLVNLKTASILWMVENWVGSEKFHRAFVNYINSRRGKYISLVDFTTKLDLDTVECQEQFLNGHTSSNVLNSWFNRPGYPVIDVQVLRDREPNVIYLKQRQFSFTSQQRSDSNYLIPISYVVQHNQNCFNCYQPRFTIDMQSYTFNENLNGGWIILNRNATGYYRVNYDIDTWKLIARTLRGNHNVIDTLNRAQIVNDVLALYTAGDISQDLAMEVLSYLGHEENQMVWQAVIDGFDLLKIENAGCNMTKVKYEEWKSFMHKILDDLLNSRIENSFTNAMKVEFLNKMLMEFSSELRYQPTVDHLRSLYHSYLKGTIFLDPDLRRACYYNALYDDTFSPTKHFSIFDAEDRLAAEHRWREYQRFVYITPKGRPRPMPIIQSTTSTTEKPSTTVTRQAHVGGNAPTHILSLFVTLSSILLHFLLQ